LIHCLVYNIALICAISSAEVDSSSEARRHYAWGVRYEKGGLFEDALVQYRAAASLDPENAKYRCALGELLYRLKEVRAAKDALLKAVDLDSTYIRTYYILARIYYDEAKYDSVIQMYRNILSLDPNRDDVRRSLAELYRYEGMDSEALHEFEVLLEDSPEDVGLLSAVGALRLKLGRLEEALEVYDMLARLRPGDRKVERTVARIKRKLGDYEGALKMYRSLAEEDSSDYEAFLEVLALSRRLSRREEEVWALENLIRLKPKDTRFMAELAGVYIDEGKLDKARKLLDRGLKLAPDDGALLVMSGEYYWRKGERGRALEEYRRASADPRWKEYAERMILTLRAEMEQEKLKEERQKEEEFFRRGRRGS